MGWRYKAGLGLIGTVVVIWVTSAEVTQAGTCGDGVTSGYRNRFNGSEHTTYAV